MPHVNTWSCADLPPIRGRGVDALGWNTLLVDQIVRILPFLRKYTHNLLTGANKPKLTDEDMLCSIFPSSQVEQFRRFWRLPIP